MISLVLLCCIILFMFVSMINEWLEPAVAIFLALSLLTIFGIISPIEALSGFSNTGVHTVALLLILGTAIHYNGVFDHYSEKLLGSVKNIPIVLTRMMLPVLFFSAFMNNTPVVSMLTPIVRKWGINRGISPSKLLIPLSYAAILGGTITLIGTSTNLIVNGLLLKKGLNGFYLFEFSLIGIPLSLIGLLYFITIGHHLLPNRKIMTQMIQQNSHDYLFEFKVLKKSPLIGKTVLEANLRKLNNLFLVKIIRHDQSIVPVGHHESIQANDRLIFSGSANKIVSIQSIPGMELITDEENITNFQQNNEVIEVIISHNSPLIGKKIKDSQFRSKYHAAIIAIRRNNENITSGIGGITLKTGDTLLLLTGPDFIKSWSNSEDFYLISPVEDQLFRKKKQRLVFFILLVFLLIVSLNIFPILKAAMLSVLMLFLTKSITVHEAYKSMNWSVIIIMGASIGVGTAIEKTGLSIILADFIVELAIPFGLAATVILFYMTTTLLTELIQNIAAAAIMFPIGYDIALQINQDPKLFAIVTAIAASCSFITPTGYQTNLLVFSPGSYRFSDYVKVGLPLSIITMLLTTFIVLVLYS